MTNPHALPKYQQAAELLIRDIASGRLLDGERLPPERDMSAELGISVGTLRKALDALHARGLLERVQGSGNYIRSSADISGIYAFFRLELAEGGGLPSAELLSVDTREMPPELPQFRAGARAHRIRRLRRLSGVAAAIEEIWLDGAVCEQVDARDLSESLYLYYRRSLGIWIGRADDAVGVGRAPDWGPEAFGVRPGSVCGVVERRGWDQDDRVVEFSRTWFDPDRVRYVSRLR
jgi:GntR family transcriptional regulator